MEERNNTKIMRISYLYIHPILDCLDPINERQQIEIASKCNKLYLAKVQIMSGLKDKV